MRYLKMLSWLLVIVAVLFVSVVACSKNKSSDIYGVSDPNDHTAIQLGRLASLNGITAVNLTIDKPKFNQGKKAVDVDMNALQNAVELRLRNVGLSIGPDTDEVLIPTLHISTTCLTIDDDNTVIYSTNVVYKCFMKFNDRPTLLAFATTWDDSALLGYCPRKDFEAKLKERILSSMDQFCNDYLKTNPKN